MSKISYTGYLVYAGCFAATLSSAIASLVGAPRVLQALARDNLYPFLGYFGKGYGANDDPFRGYILVFIISLACVMIGNLDVVSTLLSNFFVAAYALINFSVFHASITKSPGWRPSFKYYNPWLSLLGTLLCVAVMFLIEWITAIITFVIIAILYLYIAYRKPEANWGSSTQAQQFVSTLNSLYAMNAMDEHVKNYRPKVIVFSGNPAHRGPLVDFANLITKKISLLICGHVLDEGPIRSMDNLKTHVNVWLSDHHIKAFYSIAQGEDFGKGAMNCLNMAGLGKLSPNMVLLGFKSDWAADAKATEGYLNIVHHGFDLKLGIGILRVKGGLDYSSIISEEQVVVEEVNNPTDDGDGDNVEAMTISTKKAKKAKKGKAMTPVYRGHDGKPLGRTTVERIQMFQIKKRKGSIDVWWLYDDGGLTLLLPYILKTRSQFADCTLRVFALANRKDELDRETRNMAALLAKFRIDFSDVTVIPDVTKKAKEATKAEFKMMLAETAEGTISDNELLAQKEKTNRHLRLAELLREHSFDAEMIMMTLPMPRRGVISPSLYMSWLDIMSKDLPPILFVRGNQTSVLTFYS